MTSLFSSIIPAKNGSPVPLFQNGKSMHSRYDPEKEAEQYAARMDEAGFFIIAGAGGGYFIRALKKRFPRSFILAAENSQSDIDFLMKIPVFNNLSGDETVRIVPTEKISDSMLRFYVPAFYGSFSIIETPAWASENKIGIEAFRMQTASAARAIAADYSAQSHFGKIWQRNIIANLAQIGAQSAPARSVQNDTSFAAPGGKTALIAAAGPSLDTAVSFIEKKRNELYIIATDTAYKSFTERGILCDAVVSIDGQLLSAQHFFSDVRTEGTLFIFDLCANPSAIRFIKKSGGKIAFVQTGHPLSFYASLFSERKTGTAFPLIRTGAGTVTIAALDFALKAGFSKIEVCGADFSYSEKPYMKGTYFDALYNSFSCRTKPMETAFDALMFRTELFQNGKRRTSATLDAYRKTFESVLFETCTDIDSDGFLYRAVSEKVYPPLRFCSSFDMPSFISFFKKDFSDCEKKLSYPDFSPVIASFFPAVASLRKNKNFGGEHRGIDVSARLKNENSRAAFPELLKLAYAEILRYTRHYET